MTLPKYIDGLADDLALVASRIGVNRHDTETVRLLADEADGYIRALIDRLDADDA